MPRCTRQKQAAGRLLEGLAFPIVALSAEYQRRICFLRFVESGIVSDPALWYPSLAKMQCVSPGVIGKHSRTVGREEGQLKQRQSCRRARRYRGCSSENLETIGVG